MSNDNDWTATGRQSVAAHVHNTTWRERILEPDTDPMTGPTLFAWIIMAIIAGGLLVFAWVATP